METGRLKNKTFTDNEKILIDIINKARCFVTGELELDYEDGAWYAKDYREESGGVFPINEKEYQNPIIYSEEIEEFNIDIVKVCDECHVYYVSD